MKIAISNSCAAASRLRAGDECAAATSAVVWRRAATSSSGFTMVEIALCLAIIGFALVAIIGVLPAGLNVQRENREETILNQDSTVWMDAIRSGSRGYDELTNYVDRIVVSNYVFNADGSPQGVSALVAQRGGGGLFLDTGEKIVGLLSTPKITYFNGGFSRNVVYAYCRAISGSAVDKPPQQNGEVRDLAFAYRMSVEIVPVETTNFWAPVLSRNLWDVRLFMRWPLRRPFSPSQPDPPLGDGSRMTFRSQVSGTFAVTNLPGAGSVPFYFVQPYEFR